MTTTPLPAGSRTATTARGGAAEESEGSVQHPGKLTCDLCESVIEHPDRAIGLTIPLTADLRDQLRAVLERRNKATLATSVFGGLVDYDRMIQRKWTLTVCGCLLGFVPSIAEYLERDVERHLRLFQEQHDRERLPPIGALEDL